MSDRPPYTYGAYARAVVKARARIGQYFDASLFSDPHFDILLDLYASEEEGNPVFVTDCPSVSRVAPTTTFRCIGTLEEHKLIERHRDSHDRRRVQLRLTADTKAAMTEYIREISAIPLG